MLSREKDSSIVGSQTIKERVWQTDHENEFIKQLKANDELCR